MCGVFHGFSLFFLFFGTAAVYVWLTKLNMNTSSCFKNSRYQFTEEDELLQRKLTVPIPTSEHRRVETLRQTNLLDSGLNDEQYDRYTALAGRLFKVPITLISLLDVNRQWFKSRVGLPSCFQTSRNEAFCAYSIMDDSPPVMVVPNALEDDRFASNPLVTGAPYIRFYAGAPILVDDMKIGTICIIDRKPREDGLTEKEQGILVEIAQSIADLIVERRNQAMELEVEVNQLYANILHLTKRPIHEVMQSYHGIQSTWQQLILKGDKVGGLLQKQVVSLEQEVQELMCFVDKILNMMVRIMYIQEIQKQHYFPEFMCDSPSDEEQRYEAITSPITIEQRVNMLTSIPIQNMLYCDMTKLEQQVNTLISTVLPPSTSVKTNAMTGKDKDPPLRSTPFADTLSRKSSSLHKVCSDDGNSDRTSSLSRNGSCIVKSFLCFNDPGHVHEMMSTEQALFSHPDLLLLSIEIMLHAFTPHPNHETKQEDKSSSILSCHLSLDRNYIPVPATCTSPCARNTAPILTTDHNTQMIHVHGVIVSSQEEVSEYVAKRSEEDRTIAYTALKDIYMRIGGFFHVEQQVNSKTTTTETITTLFDIYVPCHVIAMVDDCDILLDHLNNSENSNIRQAAKHSSSSFCIEKYQTEFLQSSVLLSIPSMISSKIIRSLHSLFYAPLTARRHHYGPAGSCILPEDDHSASNCTAV